MRLAELISKGPKGYGSVDVGSSDVIRRFDYNHK